MSRKWISNKLFQEAFTVLSFFILSYKEGKAINLFQHFPSKDHRNKYFYREDNITTDRIKVLDE